MQGSAGGAAALDAPDRVRALAATGLLDRPTDPAFDRLTALAASLIGVPIAFLTLVDARRQFFTSAHGLPEPWQSRRETPLSHSFCQHVVLSREPLVIRDARRHPLVCDSLAIPELGVLAYAGHPVTAPDGTVLGSFAVADVRPRDWTEQEARAVAEFATLATRELRLREVEARHESLVEHDPDPVFSLDPEGRAVAVNPAAERPSGYAGPALAATSFPGLAVP